MEPLADVGVGRVSKEWRAENVFDVLGSEVAREILVLASERPVSANELADHCGVSTPTVYRRLDALQEFDLIEEHTAIADDGHHHRRFETVVSAVHLHLDDGALSVDFDFTTDYADSLSRLWADLERESGRETGADDDPTGSPDAG
ncbi:ArsR/SmtB family transcription factor [Halospeciosus flavus]|uniref:ArsR/SmtB family transcription factor n=1 Tax=Halospeciosus flavus TaxID=3032283 RepID=A0ABD5Z5B8_9EURY|nr:helix-turn-helix domain-containing protein [Halospeciosus flavus]